ncbi:MAG: RNase adapter RapZ [Gammaproteobacteria bacterium]|nr:RNase adapter RapZ [Gammaproteobacteria bacterium]
MIIVSGLSGAGKTVALHTLEDLGYYCIDNMPCALLPALYEEQRKMTMPIAVGIDIRNQADNIKELPSIIRELKNKAPKTRILFLSAQESILLKRFSETRRKHPLAKQKLTLAESIQNEIETLTKLASIADYRIDTSQLSVYDLKDSIKQCLTISDTQSPTITIQSFGFKYGTPTDTDLMFDVRFLPNPYWEAELRQYTGLSSHIQGYLEKFDEPKDFINDSVVYLSKWLPNYLHGHRSYLTISIGCTGGKHRSVYVAEQIAKQLSKTFGHINIRHRDIPGNTKVK